MYIEKYVEKAAVSGVTREITENERKDSFQETLNKTLDNLGIDSDEYGGQIFRYIISQDTKGEILTAALDNDTETLTWKTSNAVADFLITKTEDGYGVGDLVDLVKACKDGEDPADATVNLAKEIEKRLSRKSMLFRRWRLPCINALISGQTMPSMKSTKNISVTGPMPTETLRTKSGTSVSK